MLSCEWAAYDFGWGKVVWKIWKLCGVRVGTMFMVARDYEETANAYACRERFVALQEVPRGWNAALHAHWRTGGGPGRDPAAGGDWGSPASVPLVVSGHAPETILTKLRGVFEGLEVGNWEEKRAEGLALLSNVRVALFQTQRTLRPT